MGSGTQLRRAALISRRSAGFLSGSKQSSSEPSQLTQALRIALRCLWLILEPVTSAATFCSSSTFQSMNCSISEWSVSTITILAAGRGVPPAGWAGEVGAGPGAVFEQARLAHPQIHDAALIDEVVGDRLDEAGVRLRMLVGGLGLGQLAGLEIHIEVALAWAVDAIGPMQAGVEPLRRVRC